MALWELSGLLTRSFQQIRNTPILNETVLKSFLDEVRDALLGADFPRLFVNEMERKIEEIISRPYVFNRRALIYQTVFDELSNMLDPGKSALMQEKREPIIVMFIGLKGVEKTATCAKYARYHRKMGFRPALVCAETIRTDAFHRLNNAARDEVPVYGSYTSDPALLASEGIEKFIGEKRDLIIVDTSDRHKQYTALFREMRQLADSLKPDLVIFVMDASIGQAAFDQAQAFKQNFHVGVVIVTKLNENSKAGGALCAAAAAKCPMILAEKGDKCDEFEAFEVEPFVRRLLDHGGYTLKLMYGAYQSKLRRGNKGFFDLPSVRAASAPQGHQDFEKMRRYLTIMDFMTDKELHRPNIKQMNEKRVIEIAKGSNVEVREVVEMLKTYKRWAKKWRVIEAMPLKNLIDPYRMGKNIPFQAGSSIGQTKPIPFDPLSTAAVRSKRPG